MIRLVAVDLDGTLLHSDGTVTDRTRRAIEAVDAQGVLVVFVSGRPIRWMEPLWPHVGDHGLAICSNGGIVYDVPGRRVAASRPIPRDDGLAVARAVRAQLPGTVFALEKTDGFGKEPAFVPTEQDRREEGLTVGPLEEIFDDAVVKLLALNVEMAPDDYWRTVHELVGGRLVTTWSTGAALVEMSGPGVTKASTLELVCAERDIAAAEVMAFGDMPNDIAMLQWAGTSYAMANAHPTVLAAAQRRAPANDQDGVAQVLEEVFGV